MVRSFSKKDNALINLLVEMDFPSHIAKTIVFFSKNKDCTSDEIRKVADLRQPEVSMAMQHMRDKGWIETEPIPEDRQGRPILNYKRKVAFDKILSTIISEEQKKIKDMRSRLKDLRSMLK